MVDIATTAPVTNGTAVGDGDAEQPAAPKMTRAELDAAAKAAFMADDGEEEAAEPAKPAPKKAKAKVESLEDEIVEEEADEDEIEDLEDDEDELADEIEDDEDELDKAASDKDPPELAKQREQLRKQEKRQRERLEQQAAQRDASFAREKDAVIAEWKPKIEAAQAFEKIGKHDIVGILKAKGYTEDDFADASKILWGLSKDAAADPKNREAVARLQRERETRGELAELKEWRAQQEREKAEAKTRDDQTKSVEIYLKRVTKSANDETPLVKARVESAPKATREALKKMAYVISQKTDEPWPDPRKVVRAYEKRLQATIDRAAALGGFVKAPPTAAGKAPAVQVRTKAPAIKVVDKTANEPIVETKRTNGVTLPDRNDMIERLRKIDRGELDPDTD